MAGGQPRAGRRAVVTGRYDWTARQHLEQALAIRQSAYGPNDSRVAHRQNELGTVLADLGEPAGAHTHTNRPWPLTRRSWGRITQWWLPTVAT